MFRTAPTTAPAPETPKKTKPGATDKARKYAAKKVKEARRNAEASKAGRELGKLPDPKDPVRKASTRQNFRLFCETYLAKDFPIAWSADHLELIAIMEATALEGGQLALAMPRGSGKTTLSMALAVWSTLYGHRRFVMLIAASETAAGELLDDFKSQIETNELIGDDFPEVCFPVRALEGINNRANAQTLNGKRTRIEWTDKQVRFPTVPGAASSGATVRVAGITGRVRGAKAPMPGGGSIRPDYAIIDDPQDDASAVSVVENNKREKVIKKAVLGLAGPKKKIAAVMPCTVIAPGDMADRMLDRERNPVWKGERRKLMYAMPTDRDKWDRYAELRRDSQRAGRKGEEATAFYLDNREAMDAGAKPAWPERFNPDEVSAVQYAMNIFTDNPAAFYAEYQNEPQAEGPDADAGSLDPDAVAARVTRLDRLLVPRECTRVTGFVDVSESVLWYCLTAWDERFGGSVIGYGAWPKQNRSYFAQADARPSLRDHYPNMGIEAVLTAALKDLTADLIGRSYHREGGGDPLRLDRLLVDAGDQTETVHQFVRSSPHQIVTPSRGVAIKAGQLPMPEWPKKEGERKGWNWVLTPNVGGRGRFLKFDANHWKTFVAERLRTPDGDPRCLKLFGTKEQHQLFADHCSAEYPSVMEGRDRTQTFWIERPDRRENHLWDAVVGTAVAASFAGLQWSAEAEAPRKKVKKQRDIEELWKEAQGAG